ncbi:phage tail assembly protein [Nevskia sp.]|jgi:phage FluMu protein gp41|uniref:phage tail assembly protein n=1 Tax=Nevskia sp. TaxID=1929292 RepID=UPI0025D82F8C|nr:phage tail assembly protein [Nevskia sp.]
MKTITGTLRDGITISGKTHLEFELREPTTDDLFEAEDEAGTDTPLKFNGAVIARTLVRCGTFNGPFTFQMIRKLTRRDYVTLSNAMKEAEKLGEG